MTLSPPSAFWVDLADRVLLLQSKRVFCFLRVIDSVVFGAHFCLSEAMAKTRVGVLLRESVGGNKSTNKSQDLASLTSKYHEFCKKIRALIESLKAHHVIMVKSEQTRSSVSLIVLLGGDESARCPQGNYEALKRIHINKILCLRVLLN